MYEESPPFTIPSFGVFDQLSEPFCVIRSGGSLGYANLSAKHLFKQPSNDLLGFSFSSLFSPPIFLKFQQAIASVFETGSPCSHSFPFLSSPSLYEHKFSPLLNSQGYVEAVLLMLSESPALGLFSQPSSENFLSFLAYVESSREKERSRIAREIHDDLGQTLTCIGIDLALLSKHLDSPSENISNRLSGLSQLVKTAIRSAQRISSKLHPSALDDLGVGAAIEGLASDFESRSQGLCHVELQEELAFSPQLSIALFRICEDALSVLFQQAQPRHVSIHLSRSETGTSLLLKHDGSSEISVEGNHIILEIRHRVAFLGGTFDISSSDGAGTVFSILFPPGA